MEKASLGQATQLMKELNSGRIPHFLVVLLLKEPTFLLASDLEVIEYLLEEEKDIYERTKFMIRLAQITGDAKYIQGAREYIVKIENPKDKAFAQIYLAQVTKKDEDFVRARERVGDANGTGKRELAKAYINNGEFGKASEFIETIEDERTRLESLIYFAKAFGGRKDFERVEEYIRDIKEKYISTSSKIKEIYDVSIYAELIKAYLQHGYFEEADKKLHSKEGLELFIYKSLGASIYLTWAEVKKDEESFNVVRDYIKILKVKEKELAISTMLSLSRLTGTEEYIEEIFSFLENDENFKGLNAEARANSQILLAQTTGEKEDFDKVFEYIKKIGWESAQANCHLALFKAYLTRGYLTEARGIVARYNNLTVQIGCLIDIFATRQHRRFS
ncbi:MAG: hypothetical protein PHD51_03955 [Patescibacteria group bacterium]|nr:hypothetical protein [Patescibacteria group bacterium]MDD5490881.1 hypothetical protein [Patescibacteria group bacterium]